MGGYVYIMSNWKRTVLYIGVTSDLGTRVSQHKCSAFSGFTAKYRCYYLIYYEEFNDIESAIDREKQLKNWKREWKFALIKQKNPQLQDLSWEFE